jgi:hypothetical protein
MFYPFGPHLSFDELFILGVRFADECEILFAAVLFLLFAELAFYCDVGTHIQIKHHVGLFHFKILSKPQLRIKGYAFKSLET